MLGVARGFGFGSGRGVITSRVLQFPDGLAVSVTPSHVRGLFDSGEGDEALRFNVGERTRGGVDGESAMIIAMGRDVIDRLRGRCGSLGR